MDAEKAEGISGEGGSLSVDPVVSLSSDPQCEPVAAKAAEITPELVQTPADQMPAGIESPTPAAEPLAAANRPAAASETTKADAPQADAAAEAPEAAKAEAPISGKVIVMSSGDRDWAHHGAASDRDESQGMFGMRRSAAIAAVAVLATLAGALGGALATAGLLHGGGDAAGGNHALQASVARIDADILALKTGLENNSRIAMSRLDRIEKAQAEPAARLARLNEAVERLRAAPVPAPPPVAAAGATTTVARDVTGSISPLPVPPKTEVGRLPTVEGWVLRDVSNGSALIEGRHGVYEVYAGDPVPGLGRIDAIRRQDGRWVVVTGRGLIVAR